MMSGVTFRLAQRDDVPAILAVSPDLSSRPAEVRVNLPTLAEGRAIFEQVQRHGNVHIVLACLVATGAAIRLVHGGDRAERYVSEAVGARRERGDRRDPATAGDR